MKLTWLGHACFEIAATQAVVITDPYDASVGYPIAARKADIVTVSHEHYDHNDTSWVDAGAVCREPGQYERGGVQIHGIPSYHDRFRGQKRGGNVIFKLILDGLRVCHLGDLGHRIDEALTRTIGLVDVLLIPIGGVYTIDAEDALISAGIEPRLVVAMHFLPPPEYRSPTSGSSFICRAAKLSDCSITFDRRSLTARPFRRARLLPPVTRRCPTMLDIHCLPGIALCAEQVCSAVNVARRAAHQKRYRAWARAFLSDRIRPIYLDSMGVRG